MRPIIVRLATIAVSIPLVLWASQALAARPKLPDVGLRAAA